MSKQLFTALVVVFDGTQVAGRLTVSVRAKHIAAAREEVQRRIDANITQDWATVTIAGIVLA